MRFGLKDYMRMYWKRGIKLPIVYFFQNHLFDILYGTETHTWLPKEDYLDAPKNLNHGVLYMSSWTYIIKKTTRYLIKKHSLDINEFALVDIGCGKGKVLCVWSRMFRRKPAVLLVGLDYSKYLLDICDKNLKRMGASNFKLVHCDATEDIYNFGKKMHVYYLYNPFDETILNSVLKKIKQKNCYIIYSNPRNENIFVQNGFSIIKRYIGWHPNASYILYSN